MKKNLFILFLFISITTFSQDLPFKVGNEWFYNVNDNVYGISRMHYAITQEIDENTFKVTETRIYSLHEESHRTIYLINNGKVIYEASSLTAESGRIIFSHSAGTPDDTLDIDGNPVPVYIYSNAIFNFDMGVISREYTISEGMYSNIQIEEELFAYDFGNGLEFFYDEKQTVANLNEMKQDFDLIKYSIEIDPVSNSDYFILDFKLNNHILYSDTILSRSFSQNTQNLNGNMEIIELGEYSVDLSKVTYEGNKVQLGNYSFDVSVKLDRFPLEIGNKWFYKSTFRNRSLDTIYAMTSKEIIDAVDSNTYKVLICTYKTTPMSDTTYEYWVYSNYRFFSLSSLPQSLPSGGYLYDAKLDFDKELGPNTKILLTDIEFAGKIYPSQYYRYLSLGMTSDTQRIFKIAAGIGILFESYVVTIPWKKYKYELIGFRNQGEFIGDSIYITSVPQFSPVDFKLSQNYPNPFNPTTTIEYSIKEPGVRSQKPELVTLKVYDILGREVTTLVNEVQPPGNYEVSFDGTELSSGIYYYQIRTNDPSTGSGQSFVETRKMVLIK